MPTSNKISSYQFLLSLLEGKNHEQSSRNNQSVSHGVSPLKYGGNFGGGDKLFKANL